MAFLGIDGIISVGEIVGGLGLLKRGMTYVEMESRVFCDNVLHCQRS